MEPVGGRPRSVGVPARRTPVSATRLSATVRCRLAALVCGRTAVNGGLRVVYPFLPVIAHGLGLPFAVVAGLVAARSMAGLAGPAIARGMRRAHLRTPMLVGLACTTVGCLLIVVPWPGPSGTRMALVAAGFVATGLARPLFDLPLQA